jgi:hypothetical protein
VPSMTLVFRVTDTPVFEFVPKRPSDIGDRLFFSDLLALENGGLPAGTHSGFLTVLRFVEVGDPYLPGADLLWQLEATYKLNAVGGNLPPGLKEGQITTHGLLLVRNHERLGNEARFAITGGTDAYANARGQVIETDKGRLKTLKLEL